MKRKNFYKMSENSDVKMVGSLNELYKYVNPKSTTSD